MQARSLGGAQSATPLIFSAFFHNSIHYHSNSSLVLTVRAKCFARSNSRLSLDRNHSLMSTNMTGTDSVSCRKSAPKRGLNMFPNEMEVMEARLSLLTKLIAATDGRTDLNSKQKARRSKHMCEKEQIEIKIKAYNNARPFAQAEAANPQPPPSEPINIPVAVSSHNMGLRSPNVLTAQINSEGVTAINGSVHVLPSRPSFTSINHPLKQSVARKDFQMTIPLRPAEPRKKGRGRDPMEPPSAASGGVPEPSPMYMSLARLEPQVSNMPQHILLVIDLNGTLLYRPNRISPYHFVERPSARKFLNYTLANFSVMIWSSARPENVDRMCDKLFPKQSRKQLIAIWGRDRFGLSEEDSNKRVQVYKRLERVWNDPQIQRQHPLASEGKGWHQGNTVLIDDSVEKSRSEPYNFLEVPEFNGHKGEDPNLLKQLVEYLATLRMQTNVSSHILRNPFIHRNPLSKQEGILSSSPNNTQRPI